MVNEMKKILLMLLMLGALTVKANTPNNQNNYCTDVHPNNAGHAKIAQLVEAAFANNG